MVKPKGRPRILTLDIETAPLESYTWGLWDQNVGLEMIKTEWSILAYAAKWLDNKKIIYDDVSDFANVRNDEPLLDDLWELLDEADIVVAQNGRRFDIKKINARLIMQDFAPYSPIRVVDTMEAAKNIAEFSSNKLAWLSKYLTDSPKSEHKQFPGFELWKECLNGNRRAWAEMKKYNIQDIVATEKLYLRLRPWISNHPNMGAYTGEAFSCPKCGSTSMQKRGLATTTASQYQRYQCPRCGGWSRGKSMLTSLQTRRTQLVN